MKYSQSYKDYVLFSLLTLYIFNFVDRQILALLMEPIKNDLSLSDTQLGFMSGIAFAIFYTTLGIPIARLADRSHRINIISAAVAIWSGMTVLSGMAQNFWHLVLARIGVGIGEAGCTPPAHSLITDYFTRTERQRAISIYMMGVPLGVLVGFLAGGWINEFYGWRIAFIALGLPGLVLAVVVKLTIREPKRGVHDAHDGESGASLSFFQSFHFLWRKRSYRYLVLAMALTAFVGGGIGQWHGVYFIRYHDMQTGELGTWLALMGGGVGAIAIYLGGFITGKFPEGKEALQLKLLSLIALALLPTGILWAVLSSKYGSLLTLGFHSGLYFFHYGPAYALLLALSPPSLRATASACALFAVNFLGLGLGPQIAGMLSDIFGATVGDDSLRVSIIVMYSVSLIAALCFWRASIFVSEDLQPDTLTAPEANTLSADGKLSQEAK